MRARSTWALLLSAVLALALAGPAQAIILPGGGFVKPWDLRIKASGIVDVSWKIEQGIKGRCTDWSYESGSDSIVLKSPSASAKGSQYNGLVSGGGGTTGSGLRRLAASGGSSTDESCPGVCPSAKGAAAAVFGPVGRAADCIEASPWKAPDVSGCQPSIRSLRSAQFSIQGGSTRRAIIPTKVKLTLSGAPKKPFVPCGNPPTVAADHSTILVRVPRLPDLARRGMVFGTSKDKEPCRGYPRDDGFTKTTCVIEWDVKVSIFRAG